jgi:hypothetical protein
VHPGDIVQDSEGLLYLVSEVHRWGIGAVSRMKVSPLDVIERYTRMKPGQFVVVGTAHTLPVEVTQRRKDSLALAADLARDKAAGQ